MNASAHGLLLSGLLQGFAAFSLGAALSDQSRLSSNLDLNFQPAVIGPADGPSVAVQPDGKILVWNDWSFAVGARESALVRLNADGSLDPTFRVNTRTAGGPFFIVPLQNRRILISGWFDRVDGINRRWLARLEPDGHLDPSFAPAAELLKLEGPPNILPTRTGRYLLWDGLRLLSLRPDGSLDDEFNQNLAAQPGLFPTNGLGKVVELSNNKLLCLRYAAPGEGFSLVQLNSNGTRDVDFSPPDGQFGYWPLPRAEGGVLVTRRIERAGTPGPYSEELIRLTPEGLIDPLFTPVRLSEGSGLIPVAEVNGDILAAESVWIDDHGFRSQLGRFRLDGSADTSFSSPVFSTADTLTMHGGIRGAALDQGGLVCWGGFYAANSLPRRGLARVLLDAPPATAVALAMGDFGPPDVFGIPHVEESAPSANIRVVRLGDNSAAQSVRFSTRDGTAVAGVNYATIVTNLQFVAGESEKVVPVTLLDNSVFQGAPDFYVALDSPESPGTALAPPFAIRVYDNEPGIIPGSLRLTPDGGVRFDVIARNWRVLRSRDLRTWAVLPLAPGSTVEQIEDFPDPPGPWFYKIGNP